MVQWWNLVSRVINLHIPYTTANILPTWAPISLSKWTLFHGDSYRFLKTQVEGGANGLSRHCFGDWENSPLWRECLVIWPSCGYGNEMLRQPHTVCDMPLHGSVKMGALGGLQASLRETDYQLFMFNNISFPYWSQTQDDVSVEKVPRLRHRQFISVSNYFQNCTRGREVNCSFWTFILQPN